MAEHGLDGLLYGHFGDGCVHVRIDFPFADRAGPFRAVRSSRRRSWWRSTAARCPASTATAGPAASCCPPCTRPRPSSAFAAVKGLFDPDDVLNPGVMVDPAPVDADLRVPPAARRCAAGLGFAYPHDGGDLSDGRAPLRRRGQVPGRHHRRRAGVMCPSYLATRDEKDSTRGRARVLQELANGSLVTAASRSAEVAESLDLCLSCKGCSSDCPAGVDMATYKAEVLYQRYRRRLRPARPLRARLAAPLGPAGLAARPGWPTPSLRARRWPRLAKRRGRDRRRAGRCRGSPRRPSAAWFAEPAGAGSGRDCRSLLWVDTFTDHFTPEVGQAAVRVLEAAGYAVRITGRAGVLRADLDLHRPARRGPPAAAAHPATPWIRALQAGIPIVGLEPSCTAVLRGDIAELLPDDPRARQVARRHPHAGRAAGRRPPGWTPPDLAGVRAVAQPHCHHHAVMGWDADAALLAGAGAEVDAVGGCCGLAGNFGVERGHYDVSRGRGRDRAAARRARGRATRWCWPTGSPAAPSSTSSPASAACTWPSCWPAAGTAAGSPAGLPDRLDLGGLDDEARGDYSPP